MVIAFCDGESVYRDFVAFSDRSLVKSIDSQDSLLSRTVGVYSHRQSLDQGMEGPMLGYHLISSLLLDLQ